MRKRYEELTTPAFVVDEQELKQNMQALNKALEEGWGNTVTGYSYKTNSLPWIINYMQGCGCYAEVVSDTEYALAERIGYEDRIILNGPVKGKACFYRALERENIVNLDSRRELAWLKEHGAEGIRAKIGLRVNFNLERECPGETVAGESGSRFGFCAENGELDAAAKALEEAGIRIAGLHMHTSTKSRSLGIFRALAAKAVLLAGERGWRLSYIDIGGGFFAGGTKREAYQEYIRVIADELRAYAGPEELCLIVEPGASVIASAVSYVTKVVDVKDTAEQRFVVTDGSRLHIDPFLAKERYPYMIHGLRRDQADLRPEITQREQIICGYTCMEKDRLMKLAGERELWPGDRIAYDCVGSYTMSFLSLFIEYFPDVYVKNEEGYRLVREKWGVEEFLQKSFLE